MPSSLFGTRSQVVTMPTAQQNPQLDPQIQEMYQRLSHSNNPDAEVQNMLANDPRLMNISRMVSIFRGDFKTAFLNEAKRRGVNPNLIINILNNQ